MSKLQKLLEQVFNPVALRKANIVYNFGLSECNRVKQNIELLYLRAVGNLTCNASSQEPTSFAFCQNIFYS